MKKPGRMAKVLQDYIRVWSGRSPKKSLVTFFELNMNCNLRCDYCYIKNDPRSYPEGFKPKGLDLTDIKKVIERISRSSHALSLYGGEPFLKENLKEILLFSKKQNFLSLEVVTNGTLLMKHLDVVELLDVINISYDCTRERQYPEKMKQVLVDALWIKKHMNKSIMFFVTVTEQDDFLKMRPLLDFMQEYGFYAFFQPVRNDSLVHDLRWFNGLMVEIKSRYKELFLFNQISFYRPFDYKLCLPELSMSVTYRGELIYPCQMFRNRVVGSLLQDEVKDLWARGKSLYGEFPCRECEQCGYLCMWDIGNNFRQPWKVGFFGY